jgi:hypothetical protein
VPTRDAATGILVKYQIKRDINFIDADLHKFWPVLSLYKNIDNTNLLS